MNIQQIIANKRDKKILSQEEIEYFVNEYVKGNITDYQAAALVMAIYLNGMTEEETTMLTLAMARSGETLDLSTLNKTVVDKHSTGGVGDKITIVLMPIIASLGIPVAKMSGRGLGFTGGTIDKLESIPGYNTEIPINNFIEIVKKTGISVIGQTANLAPADKKLYALRDTIACVDSMPLIASSIMSKKIAAGAEKIVLDGCMFPPNHMIQLIVLEEWEKTSENDYNVEITYDSLESNPRHFTEKYKLVVQYAHLQGYTDTQKSGKSDVENAIINISNSLDSIRNKMWALVIWGV